MPHVPRSGCALLAAVTMLAITGTALAASSAQQIEESLLINAQSVLATNGALPRLSDENPALLSQQMLIIQYGVDNRGSIQIPEGSASRALIYQVGSGNQATIVQN